jgi:phospholipase C
VSFSKRGRRDFIRSAAKTAGVASALTVLPPSIQKALAIPPASGTGTLQDVEHIVIFMQENRSFDHYYGTMRGVRGFGDRISVPLSGHRSVWRQQSTRTGQEVLPFHLDTAQTRAQCVASLDHGWRSGHEAWNHGKYDNWIDAKSGLTMGYYKESDIPFQFALANAFTICDAYFCSVMGPTDPNRIYLWTGSVNPPGNEAGALIDNDLAEKYVASWITCPERLEKAGISWRIYQKGLEYDGKLPFEGNYGDNPLVYFKQYFDSAPDSKLRREALMPHPLSELARDVRTGQLPQVSWIVAPEAYSEHPAWPPAYGAQYTSEVLDALTSNPKVWSKTVLFINYDENDGYFDHVVPPTPPVSREQGSSTVDAADEIYDDPKLGRVPYGLGARVPMIVVSPWTRGGWVCSEVFDHTSVLRFVEARFGASMLETNITAWRRAVCGDLTSAFDFTKANDSVPRLPDTSGYRAATDKACSTLPNPAVPAVATEPVQEPGTRPARAIPYKLHARSRIDVDDKRIWIDFANEGKAGAVFHCFSVGNAHGPWTYTVEAGKELSDYWLLTHPSRERRGIANSEGKYNLSVYGPNGFLRECTGSITPPAELLVVTERYDAARMCVGLLLHNPGPSAATITVRDNAYGNPVRTYRLAVDGRHEDSWELAATTGWYDLSVSCDLDPDYVRRFAGHVENGMPSISDPAMAHGFRALARS